MTYCGCGGAVIRGSDGFAWCFSCGVDADFPPRPPTQQDMKDAINRGGNRKPEVVTRNDRIVAMHYGGATVKELAALFDLSLNTIRQIINQGL